MGDLIEFAKRLKDRMQHVDHEPRWDPAQAEQYMADVALRRQLFDDLASRIRNSIIQPRMELLASFFLHATPTRNEPTGCCTYWFGYTERFPASTRLSFALEHDVRLETLIVCYEAIMRPVFFKFPEHDRLTMKLEELWDPLVTNWVEERILEFLDAYMQIDRGGDDFSDEPVTDPVCGMRISRSAAAASETYRGHPYFFCSTDCLEEFGNKPEVYVEMKGI